MSTYRSLQQNSMKGGIGKMRLLFAVPAAVLAFGIFCLVFACFNTVVTNLIAAIR